MDQKCGEFKRPATEFMEINGKLMIASTVEIIDIGWGGIALQTKGALKIGTEYMIRLKTKDHFISVKGVVVWSELRASEVTAQGKIVPLYAVGMRFTDLATKKISALTDFIEFHTLENGPLKLHNMSGQRFNMRYNLAEKVELMLTCPEDFSVKMISAEEMLIETEHAFGLDQSLPMLLSPPQEKAKLTLPAG